MEFPDDVRYTDQHEWVRVDGARATVGITDYAQDALGDVVFVELPPSRDHVDRGARVCEVESTKSVSDIYAPVSGTIVEVNEALADAPEQLNAQPYGDGWMFVMEISDVSELDGLMDSAAYRDFVEQ